MKVPDAPDPIPGFPMTSALLRWWHSGTIYHEWCFYLVAESTVRRITGITKGCAICTSISV